jgi:CRISPR-associated protein Cas2
VAYLIAYDVSHPCRLRRVARLLERRAVRCQYSVFLFRGTATDVVRLLDEVGALIRPAEDVVQAWPVPPGVLPDDLARGAVRIVRPAAVILAAGRTLVVPPLPPAPRPHPDETPP